RSARNSGLGDARSGARCGRPRAGAADPRDRSAPDGPVPRIADRHGASRPDARGRLARRHRQLLEGEDSTGARAKRMGRCEDRRSSRCDDRGTSTITKMASDPTSPRRSRITVRRYTDAAEADRHDLEFWMQMSDAERVMQAWRLSEEIWRLRGD